MRKRATIHQYQSCFSPRSRAAICPLLIIAEFETKQVKILPDMLRIGGAGDHHNTALQVPAQDDLSSGHAMRLSNRLDCFIPKQIGSIASAAQRILI